MRTREQIIALAVDRLLAVVDEHGAQTVTMDEVSRGDTGLRLNVGRYGDAIADAATARRTDLRVHYLRGDRTTGRWTSSYFDVIRDRRRDCDGDPKCATHRGGAYNMTTKTECRR